MDILTSYFSNTSATFLVATSALGLLASLVYYFDKCRLYLSKIPHYKNWPIVGDVLHLPRTPLGIYDLMIKIGDEKRKHGLFKLCLPTWTVVFLVSPSAIEKLLQSNLNIDKSGDYDFLHKWLGYGLLTSTGKKWKARRRLLTPSFHFNILKDFLVTMNQHAQSLVEKLQSEDHNEKTPFDIFPHITHNALDIICDTAMGVNIDALHSGNIDYVDAVYLVKDAISTRQRTPWIWPDFIYDNLPIGKKVNQAISLMHKEASKIIAERKELQSSGEIFNNKTPKAFLDILLNCKDENGEPLSDEAIREEVDTFMFEGHDTVSSALAYAVFLLGIHQDVQRKCQDELDDIFAEPRDATTDDLAKMAYLEWCIKETLRLYPSVPWFARAISEDTEFDGMMVPKGISVTPLAITIHRDPNIYPDPEKFDPLRFSPDQCAGRHPYAFIPFSAGPRNCIGQRFAMMELKVVLSALLRNFNITSHQTRDDVKPNPGLILQPSAGIMVSLQSRC